MKVSIDEFQETIANRLRDIADAIERGDTEFVRNFMRDNKTCMCITFGDIEIEDNPGALFYDISDVVGFLEDMKYED